MVIEDLDLVEKMVPEFKTYQALDLLFIPVYDHFVDVILYHNTVKWEKIKLILLLEYINLIQSEKPRKWHLLIQQLLIYHRANPSIFQAFHFELYKMMKVIQPNVFFANKEKTHWKTVRKIYNRYQNERVKVLFNEYQKNQV